MIHYDEWKQATPDNNDGWPVHKSKCEACGERFPEQDLVYLDVEWEDLTVKSSVCATCRININEEVETENRLRNERKLSSRLGR
jgi:hypothetical protein